MINVTAQAAQQILKSSSETDPSRVYLRLAARRDEDGNFDYGMGFDDPNGNDHVVTSEGVNILISPDCAELLVGATLDYVEINPGDFRFIFMNPNDAGHRSGDDTSRKS